jgi:hypothetical protein
VLSSLSVALGTGKATFSAAVDKTGRIYVEGQVKNGTPYLTKVGGFDVELAMQGSVLLCRQRDQPGIVGNVGMALAKSNINISFMTVCRTSRNEEAIMAIGIDDEPTGQVREGAGWRGCSRAGLWVVNVLLNVAVQCLVLSLLSQCCGLCALVLFGAVLAKACCQT